MQKEEEPGNIVAENKKGKQPKREVEDTNQVESRVYYMRKPHTIATNKLKLGFKAQFNPRLKESIVIDEEEDTGSSKGKKKTTKKRKIKSTKRKE